MTFIDKHFDYKQQSMKQGKLKQKLVLSDI